MTNHTDENQMFDPSLVDGSLEFNIEAFENLNDDFFNQNNSYDNSILDGSATATPAFDHVNFSKQPQEMIPMQHAFFPSPATLTPTQVLPTPPPGMAYHPQVGWYYPANMPSQLPGQGQFGMPHPFAAPPAPPASMYPQATVPQIPQIPQFSAAPVDETAKKPEAKRTSRGTKRKYGPAAYLEAQAKRRANGDDSGPRPVSRDFEYPAPSGYAPQVKRKADGAMKDLKTATVQRCRCAMAKKVATAHIPRPRNKYIIFRNDFSAQWRTSKGQKRGTANADISKAAGETWQALGEKGQAKYAARAAIEKAEHKRQYPEYHYTPIKKIQAHFGQPDCTCGAYQVNLTELRRLKEGGATPPNKFTLNNSEAEDDDEGDYVAPSTRSVSRANSYSAPTVQMVPNQFDFSFDTQVESANLGWDSFNEATEQDDAEPPAKRRSTRNSKKAVHYADEEDVTANSSRKHRPSPILTSRKASNTSQVSELNSADFQLTGTDNESVASRTRSKSISMTEGETFLPTGNSTPNSLFDDDSELGENITVASPKPASPKKSRGRGRRGS